MTRRYREGEGGGGDGDGNGNGNDTNPTSLPGDVGVGDGTTISSQEEEEGATMMAERSRGRDMSVDVDVAVAVEHHQHQRQIQVDDGVVVEEGKDENAITHTCSTSSSSPHHPQPPPSTSSPTPTHLSPFESSLDPSSTGATVLSYLEVSCICHGVALTSKTCRILSLSEELWRFKFTRKWNYFPDEIHSVTTTGTTTTTAAADGEGGACPLDEGGKVDEVEHDHESEEPQNGEDRVERDGENEFVSVDSEGEGEGGDGNDGGFWRGCFVSAYTNRHHDLWVTHWNVVEPIAGCANVPGRCCLPDLQFTSSTSSKSRMRKRPVKKKSSSVASEEGTTDGGRGRGVEERKTGVGVGVVGGVGEEEETLPSISDLVSMVSARDDIDGDTSTTSDPSPCSPAGAAAATDAAAAAAAVSSSSDDVEGGGEGHHGDHRDDEDCSDEEDEDEDVDEDEDEDESDGERVGVVLEALRKTTCPTCRHHPCLPYNDVEVDVAAGAELRYRGRRRRRRPTAAEAKAFDHTSWRRTEGEEHECRGDEDATVDDPVLRAEGRAVSACVSRRGHRSHGRGLRRRTAGMTSAAAAATTPAGAWYWVAQYGAAKWCRRMTDLYGEGLLRMAGASDDDDWDSVGNANGGDVGETGEGGGGGGACLRTTDVKVSRAVGDTNGGGHSKDYPHPGRFEVGRLRRHLRRCRRIRWGKDRARDRAKRAFEAAATWGRSINAEQYRSSGLRFMTDAIFFPTLAATGAEEEDHLIKDVYGEEARSKFLNAINPEDSTARATSKTAILRPIKPMMPTRPIRQTVETAPNAAPASFPSHTWHVARFTNPCHDRPILWRVLVQRGECFGAYPSEGLLRPGETSHVYLCVYGLGSLMSRSADRINREREEVDPFVAEIFNAEGPLPYCPFAIRYLFGPVPPCLPRGYNVRKARLSISDYMWQTASPEEVRTIYLNAHVNASYFYEDFRANTLVPFEIRENKERRAARRGGRPCGIYGADACDAAASTADDTPLTLTSPLLHEMDRTAFDTLHGIRLDVSVGEEGLTYRTERRCLLCGRDWGARSEELARSVLLCKMRWEVQARLRLMEIGLVGNYLSGLVSSINDVLPELARETFTSTRDQEANCVCSISAELPSVTSCIKAFVDDCVESSLLRSRGNELKRPWRLSRLYKCLYRVRFEMLWLRWCPSIFFANTNRERHRLQEYERRLEEACIRYHVHSVQRGHLHPWKKLFIDRHVHCPASMLAHLSYSEYNKFSGFESTLTDHSAGFVRFKADDFTQLSSQLAPKSKATADWLLFVVKIGIAIAFDPRSLFVNGIYDRVRSPDLFGQLFACVDPLFIRPSSCPPSDTDLSKTAVPFLLQSWSAHAFPPLGRNLERGGWGWKEEHDPDPDGLNLMHLGPLDMHKNRVLSNESSPLEQSSVRDDDSSNHAASVPAHSYERNGIPDNTHFVDTHAAEHGEEVSNEVQNDLNRQAGIHRQGQVDFFPGRDRRRIAPREQHPRVGRRVVNLVGLVCSYLGWSADDRDAPLVERRILVAAQWLSNSFALCPLFLSLVARSLMWLTPCPIDYHLEGQPFSASKSLRYLSCEECAYAALMVFAVWLVMGLNNERQTGVTTAKDWHLEKPGFSEFRSSFYADSGGAISDEVSKHADFGLSCKHSTSLKLGLSLMASIASFCTVSPHFALNLLIVFFCGVALGLSMSIESMEMGRETPSLRPFGLTKMKLIKSRHLIVSAFLIGHIVGSSGGIYFLAEFVVTSVSFLLGGVATVSTSAVESWLCFVTFSSAAFWGLFFARVGVLDAMQRKRCGGPSISLLWSLIVASLLWVYVMLFREGGVPTTLMIRRPDRPKMDLLLRKRSKNGSGQLSRLQ